MTPAKLIALQFARGEELELRAYPIDKLGWLYSNKNRDPGGEDANGVVRPAAPFMPIEDFKTIYNRRRTLAAKVNYDHNLMGAIADKDAWETWVNSKTKG